jgi:hypothetical protein
MGLFNTETFYMHIEGDVYSFTRALFPVPISHISDIEGTTKDISFMIFKKYLRTQPDGYGNIYTDSVGPFWIASSKNDIQITVDAWSKIEPEPSQEFWDELNGQFKRFMRLIAFS